MSLQVVERKRGRFLAASEGEPLLESSRDTGDLIGACMGERVRDVLLLEEHLPPRFFELATGEAGELLQKLRTYGIRLAAVVPDTSRKSDAALAMLREEGRGQHFRVFASPADAEEWLLAAN